MWLRKRFNWPPSIAEFIQLARPPVEPDQAYHEAVIGLLERRAGRMGEWSHRAIYWAAQELQHDLLTQPQEQMKARWKRALAKQLERTSHEGIPAPVVQLPAPGHTQLEREEARARVRGDQSGSFRLDGAGLAAIPFALELHDEQLKLVVYRDIHRVEVMMETRMAQGNVYTYAPSEAQ